MDSAKFKINAEIANKGIDTFYEFAMKELKTDGEIKKIGYDKYKINPAPCCGHNDCFCFNSNIPAYNCFSCGAKGSAADFPSFFTDDAAEISRILNDFTGITMTYAKENPERVHQSKLYNDAVTIYQKQLSESTEAMDYLTNVRKRKTEIITGLKYGFCKNENEFKKAMLALGYSNEEIKSVYIPQGLFVFPYFNQKGHITRMNTKNYLKLAKEKDENGELKDKKGYAIGPRYLLYSPYMSNSMAYIVEGEMDYATLIEQGCRTVIATGGNPTEAQIEELGKFKILYLCFDNDDGGRKFVETVNEKLPHVNVFKIEFPSEYKDLDQYYRDCGNPIPYNELGMTRLGNDGFKSIVNSNSIKLVNRVWRLEIDLDRFNEKTGKFLCKSLKYYEDELLKDTATNFSFPDKLPKNFLQYYDKIESLIDGYFNSNYFKRDLYELFSIVKFTANRDDLISEIVKRFNEMPDDDKEVYYGYLSKRNSALLTEIKQEINKKEITALTEQGIEFPLLSPVQNFVINSESPTGYMYFNATKAEKDKLFEEPAILTSDKRIIKLKEFSLKDPDEIIVIDKKFKIRDRIKGKIIDDENCSLKEIYVKKFLDGTIKSEDLSPDKVVREIEDMFRKLYFTTNDHMYKVLAIFCYATYFSDVFAALPYIFIQSEKGCGKSTLLSLLKSLCFNPYSLSNLTVASLLRTADNLSTIIIDEWEGKGVRSINEGDELVGLIKSGYSKASGGALRTHPTDFFRTVSYNVYCPKIFAGIGDIDEVLRDRAIKISLKQYKPSEITGTLSEAVFFNLYSENLVRLSSYCALSALTNFQDVYDKFQKIEINSVTLRNRQLFRPLFTLASLIGNDYIEAIKYYDKENALSKVYGDSQSVEGIIKQSVNLVFRSYQNFQTDLDNGDSFFDVISSKKETPKSNDSIKSNADNTELDEDLIKEGHIIFKDGYFRVNSFALLVIANQISDSQTITLKKIHDNLPKLFTNIKLANCSRTTTKFDDFFYQNIYKLLGEKKSLNVYWFEFSKNDISDEIVD